MITFETFRDIGSYEIGSLTQKEPSCFNRSVRIEKFRVTIELIDEPKEVIAERLQKLWGESNNHHDHEPLVAAAKKHGVTLEGWRGTKRK